MPDTTPLDGPLEEFFDDKAKTITTEVVGEEETKTRSGTYVADLQRVVPKWIDWTQRETGVETLDELDAGHLASWAKELAKKVKDTDEELSAQTARKYYSYIRSYLSYCVSWEYIDSNPAKAARAEQPLPKATGSKSSNQQFWSDEQRETLMRYVTDRAHEAIDTQGNDYEAYVPVRDRAFCSILAYTGARGAEFLNHPQDDREDRSGAAWDALDLDRRQLDVLGKSQKHEEVPTTSHPVEALRRWKQLYDPPSDEWPIFPSFHAPSLWGTLRETLRDRGKTDAEIDDILDSHSRPLIACVELEVEPPALSTSGGQSIMQRLTAEAGVDVQDDPKDYLTLHGSRRGVGQKYWAEDGLSMAQKALRHADPTTTEEMYSQLDTSEISEVGDRAFDH